MTTIYQDTLTTLRIVKRNKIHKQSSWEICLILDYSVKPFFSVKPTNRSDVTVYFFYPWSQPTCIGKVSRCEGSKSSMKNACRMPWTAKNPSFSTSLRCQFADLHCCMWPIQLHGITLSRLLYCMKKSSVLALFWIKYKYKIISFQIINCANTNNFIFPYFAQDYVDDVLIAKVNFLPKRVLYLS